MWLALLVHCARHFNRLKQLSLAGASGANTTMWWTNLIFCSSHFNSSNALNLVGKPTGTPQCDGLCWWNDRTTKIIQIILLAWGSWCDRNNVMVHDGPCSCAGRTAQIIQKHVALLGTRHERTVWWFMLLYLYNHLGHLIRLAWLAEAVRPQQCDGRSWSAGRANWIIKLLAGAGQSQLVRINVVVTVGAMLKPFKSFESVCLAGGSGANIMWWTVLVCCSSRLNYFTQFAWLGDTVRPQRCDGSWWSTARAIQIIWIALLGWGEPLERNHVMVHVGALRKSIFIMKIISLGWWELCGNNDVVDYVCVLPEPLKTC